MENKTVGIAEINRRRLVQSLVVGPFLGIAGVASGATDGAAPTDNLAGVWRRELDPDDQGIRGGWHGKRLPDRQSLPGSLERNAIGYAVTTETPWTGGLVDRGFFTDADYARYRRPGEVKVPFFLQPDTWYRGAVWYQREIDVPTAWRGKRIALFLERAHWETRVWIDDRSIGRSDALHVPHVHDLGELPPGRHRLTIRVDNRMIVEIGHNSHGVTDHTQGNWNGIAGRIELRASEPAWIERVDLVPAPSSRVLNLHGTLRRVADATPMITADIELGNQTIRVPVTWNGMDGSFHAAIRPDPADAMTLRGWDEFDPMLHDVSVRLANGENWEGRFGWRDLVPTPMGFTMNGRPAMLRGTLDCSTFPLTGHPPTDVESWRRIMRRVKEHGFNHLRFHSYCPPETAFDAADELGLYVQVETVWANESAHVGGGMPVDRWIYAETDRILAAYGNHPSFVMMTHGNEPGSPKTPDGDARRDAFLGAYVRHYRALDPRRLWTSGAGWPEIADNQYHVTPSPRVQAWGEGLASRINSKPPETQTDYRKAVTQYQVPVVSHEIGQWCAYPDLNERRKYTGHLKAKNLDIFADRLHESGLQSFAPEFLYASGRLQVLCYKEEVESALRTPGFGGFQLLGLQDFPGQGTATVGVLDPFWDDKGYTTATEYRRFCAPTVVLARMQKRVVQSGEAFAFTIDVAHFGSAAVDMAQIDWHIHTVDNRQLARGAFPPRTVPLGNAPLNMSVAPVLKVLVASAARLTVTIRQAGRLIAENDWDLWIYPVPRSNLPAPERLRHAGQIDAALLDHLIGGGDALIGLDGTQVTNYAERPVQLGFSSIFWNTLWTQRQAPTTLGIMCDPRHAALADFPTEAHSNWQWWYPLHAAGALRLDLLPANIEPIVRVIDDWFTARSLGLIVEFSVGRGRVIVCGFAVDGPLAENPVTRQLVASLHRYMAGAAFKPSVQVTARQLQSLAVRND